MGLGSWCSKSLCLNVFVVTRRAGGWCAKSWSLKVGFVAGVEKRRVVMEETRTMSGYVSDTQKIEAKEMRVLQTYS